MSTGPLRINKVHAMVCSVKSRTSPTSFFSMKLSISLNKQKAPSRNILQAAAFGANNEDDLIHHDEQKPIAHAAETSKAMQKRMAAEKQIDATVYEYDEVWDKIQESKQRQQAAKEADVAARKVN